VRPLERILVRLPNWLGDVLMARPLLFALRAAHPGAALWCVGPSSPHGLLIGDQTADSLLAWSGDGALDGPVVARTRAWRPDAALVLPPSFSSAWFAWRTRARERIGYRGEGRALLLTRALRRPARGDRHLAEEFLALGAGLGVAGRLETPPCLRVSDQDLEGARSAVRGTPAQDLVPFALLGPGARYGPAKRWAPERFAEVGRAFAARGLAVLAVGGGDERGACEEVAARIGPRAASLAGRTGIGGLAALAAHASVAVCNDSGLAHLCAAAGAPTVAVFGSTSSAWTAPLGPRVRVVQRAPVCAPCFARTCAIGYPCLEAVEVAMVRKAAWEVAA
jgi:heptosyltransferase-2